MGAVDSQPHYQCAVDMRLLALASVVLVAAAAADCRRHKQEYAEFTALGRGYRLQYAAASWPGARDRCAGAGGKLATPKSEAQFEAIQSVVRKMHFPSVQGGSGRPLAWVGVSNLGDYRTWRNVDGEDITDTGYSSWSGPSSWKNSDNPEEPHCAALEGLSPGLRVHWCHLKQPYICEHALKPTVNSTR